jgi:hypothetical protein
MMKIYQEKSPAKKIRLILFFASLLFREDSGLVGGNGKVGMWKHIEVLQENSEYFD